jgi:hypothetical protein
VLEVGEDVEPGRDHGVDPRRLGGQVVVAVRRVAEPQVAEVGTAILRIDPRDSALVESRLDVVVVLRDVVEV